MIGAELARSVRAKGATSGVQRASHSWRRIDESASHLVVGFRTVAFALISNRRLQPLGQPALRDEHCAFCATQIPH